MSELTPEEIELARKRRILDRLKDRLADREEEMADLRGGLEQFEARYKMEVGRLYADLDEIDARIAEEEYKLVPDDEEIKKKAEELRRRAEESAANSADPDACSFKWNPTPESRKAYHDLARIIHPDLALDPDEKVRRHSLMAKLNEAYSAGDQAQLNRLVEEYKISPDVIRGESTGDDLVRAIRQIAQIKVRLAELRTERVTAELSELFVLREKVLIEFAEGRDLLKHMAERTRSFIKKSERRLENLKSVNEAAEEYVKDRYGMDISAFRRS
jgi:hypothetical protein